jgi:hypothetical protein
MYIFRKGNEIESLPDGWRSSFRVLNLYGATILNSKNQVLVTLAPRGVFDA